MPDIQDLTRRIIDFRDERDWKQFHKPKDLATGLMLESGEVAEHFLWKSDEEIKEHIKSRKEEIGDEIADVLHYLLIMCHDLDIDIIDATQRKIEKNKKRYPAHKARGSHEKYTAYMDEV